MRSEGRTLLTEWEAKAVLAAYGLPVVETCIARSEAEAVAAADRLGYPVVLKLYSPTITHKTDVGGVALNLPDAAAVITAYQQIEKNVTTAAGAGHFAGVTVQPMIPWKGFELILGSSTDAQFGPVILFGTGGQLVEVLEDTAIALPPEHHLGTPSDSANENLPCLCRRAGLASRQPCPIRRSAGAL